MMPLENILPFNLIGCPGYFSFTLALTVPEFVMDVLPIEMFTFPPLTDT